MRYSVFTETQSVPPLGAKTLTPSRSVAGEFSPATFEGWNRFYGPTGWTPLNSFVFYTRDSLSNKDVLEVEGKKYGVTGGYKGRVRNIFFLVKYG